MLVISSPEGFFPQTYSFINPWDFVWNKCVCIRFFHSRQRLLFVFNIFLKKPFSKNPLPFSNSPLDGSQPHTWFVCRDLTCISSPNLPLLFDMVLLRLCCVPSALQYSTFPNFFHLSDLHLGHFYSVILRLGCGTFPLIRFCDKHRSWPYFVHWLSAGRAHGRLTVECLDKELLVSKPQVRPRPPVVERILMMDLENSFLPEIYQSAQKCWQVMQKLYM